MLARLRMICGNPKETSPARMHGSFGRRLVRPATSSNSTRCLALSAGLAFILIAAPVANAHHGRDFLLTQTAHLPAQGEIFAISRQDYIDEGEDQEYEFQPAVIGAVTDWLTLELHSHIEKPEGESAEYESTAAVGYFRFTPRESAFAVGGAVEYAWANHSDDEDVWGIAGIASYETAGWMLGVNLLAEREATGGADTEWGYAAGARRSVTEVFAVGLEVAGSFEDEKEGEVLLGIFADPLPWLTINVGVGTGFNDGIDLSVRTALIFKLR